MKKAALVIPYFGKFPNYFELFLKSMGCNPDVHLHLFTDDRRELACPGNVFVHYTTFEETVERFRQKIDAAVCIPRPHKLCDFKPTYGLVYEEYLKDYDYWGYCDCDTIMGDLNRFLQPLFEQEYDKVFAIGHLSFIRNTPENNRMFMEELNGEVLYKQALCRPETFWLDEAYKPDRKDINSLFLAHGKQVFFEDYSLNPICETMYFHQCVLNPASYAYETVREPLFYARWDHGNIQKVIVRKGKLCVEDFCYLHLQRRRMAFDPALLQEDAFRIVPDAFQPKASLDRPNCFNTTSRSGVIHYMKFCYAMLVRRIRKLTGKA